MKKATRLPILDVMADGGRGQRGSGGYEGKYDETVVDERSGFGYFDWSRRQSW